MDAIVGVWPRQQFGLITRAQALSVGLSESALDRRDRIGTTDRGASGRVPSSRRAGHRSPARRFAATLWTQRCHLAQHRPDGCCGSTASHSDGLHVTIGLREDPAQQGHHDPPDYSRCPTSTSGSSTGSPCTSATRTLDRPGCRHRRRRVRSGVRVRPPHGTDDPDADATTGRCALRSRPSGLAAHPPRPVGRRWSRARITTRGEDAAVAPGRARSLDPWCSTRSVASDSTSRGRGSESRSSATGSSATALACSGSATAGVSRRSKRWAGGSST